ncbi:MAG: response regulator, partial [Anaerolineales bacterium]|nr:response regulator [Anaerolineales bacterium]
EGYLVAVNAADGSLEQVIWSIEHEHPDLVILDVNLGDYSGFDVLARMKANENLKNTHVLMSSGIEYTQQSRDAGADGFILKPYMPDDFVGYIQHVLGQ